MQLSEIYKEINNIAALQKNHRLNDSSSETPYDCRLANKGKDLMNLETELTKQNLKLFNTSQTICQAKALAEQNISTFEKYMAWFKR